MKIIVMADDIAFAERIKDVAVKPPTPQEVADLRFSGYILGIDTLKLMWGDPNAPEPKGILYGTSPVLPPCVL